MSNRFGPDQSAFTRIHNANKVMEYSSRKVSWVTGPGLRGWGFVTLPV